MNRIGRLSRFMAVTALVAALATVPAYGQGRGGGQRHGNRQPSHGQTYTPNRGHRPGNNQPGHGHGYTSNNGHRPGNNQPGHGHGYTPNNGHRPGPGHNPGYRPGHNYSHNHGHHGPHAPFMAPPPRRPMRPAWRPWAAPPPPGPHWRPAPGGPVFNTILGIAIGASVANTIDGLLNGGYAVDGYNNGVVYVRNVMQLGCNWPDASLYYNSAGGLMGTQFYYTMPYYSTDRYNMVYRTLYNRYGAPVVNSAGQAVWYGPSGNYISLSIGLAGTDYSGNAYVTTLTFGN